tara:strand:+ start:10272 stop:10781 length:510 start_codon:yes stop_codon:yes gene_type:complete
MTNHVLIEALEDPDLPAHLAREIIDYLGSRPLDDLEDNYSGPKTVDPPALVRKVHPMVALRLGGLITQVIVSVMPPRTTLRHALAFQMIALAHFQGREITVAGIQSNAGLDACRRPVFGSSFPKTHDRLIQQGLVRQGDKSKIDDRTRPLVLTPKGLELVSKALEQAGV